MILDEVSNPIFTAKDLIAEIYKGNLHLISLSSIDLNDLDYMSYVEFLEDNNLNDWPLPQPYFGEVKTKEEFDCYMHLNWFMPEEYYNFDVYTYCIDKCHTELEKNRVNEEFNEFKLRNMIRILQWLKYFVDTCIDNEIVWGVGRGSSVSSFVLYLLNVHKINSIKYNLNWKEFLR